MWYIIVTEGKENPKNQKGYNMKKNCVGFETISISVWKNLREKVYLEYTQSDLFDCFNSQIPVFVRWNNRNVYGTVYYVNGCYIVNNFYRITRDGSPVRLYVD